MFLFFSATKYLSIYLCGRTSANYGRTSKSSSQQSRSTFASDVILISCVRASCGLKLLPPLVMTSNKRLHQPRVIRRDKNADVIRQHNGVTCMLMHLCVKNFLGIPLSITFLSIVAIMTVECNFSATVACRHYTIAVRARFPNRIPGMCSNSIPTWTCLPKRTQIGLQEFNGGGGGGGCTSIPDKHTLAAIQSATPSTYPLINLLPITSCAAPDKTLPFFGF